MVVEEIFPHVQLLIGELRNGDFELDNEVARIALLADQSSLSNEELVLLGCEVGASVNLNWGPIDVFELFREAEQGLFQGDVHQVDQVAALP